MGESLLLTEWGPLVGLTLFIAVAFMRGWIVPGREMRYWREMAFEEQRQKRELLEGGRVTQSVLRALPNAMEQDSP